MCGGEVFWNKARGPMQEFLPSLFRECQEPLWANFKAEYRFRQCQAEHRGFSPWLCPHVFPLGLVWSC